MNARLRVLVTATIITAMLASLSALAQPGMGRGQGMDWPSFEDFDLNGDGRLDEPEFLEARGQRMAERSRQGHGMRHLAHQPEFAEIDLDGDGFVDPGEFAQYQDRQRERRFQSPTPAVQPPGPRL